MDANTQNHNGHKMLEKIHNRGFMTHMPFVTRSAAGEPVLFFCCSDETRVWKLLYEINGDQWRMETGLPEETIECCPTAWHDEDGWHVSFIGGMDPQAPEYFLYGMDGPALNDLGPARKILAAATGFVHRDRIAYGRPNAVRIIEGNTEYQLAIPHSHFYRISYRPDQPEVLLLTIHDEQTDNVYVAEHSLTTGEQQLVECDGKAAYKCAIYGNEIIYADRVGEHYEQRRLTVATKTKRAYLRTVFCSQPKENPAEQQKQQAAEISKKRYKICKQCLQGYDAGFQCQLHTGCCFGRWRANPKNACYATPPKWEAE